MKKWEYKIMEPNIKPKKLTEALFKLNELGKDEWELIAITNTRLVNERWFFKRQVIIK
ncbi:DUF4177 domain-containing protein [Candidatus Pacearchaeota archaeon]|nr:DUF4177 domain-containing protein [Candidatus Pacearchaeota archaeon]